MFCGKCGEKLQDGAKFCGKCGWKVEAVATEPVQETVAEVKEAAEETAAAAVVSAEEPAVNETPAEETTVAEAPAEKKKAQEEAPKTGKKKKGLFLLIPLIVLLLGGIAVGVVLFLNSLKRQEVDLSDVVTFNVTGYSGYGVAEVVIKEDELEDKYEDLISDHTDLRWSKFVKEVDLLEYEVTDLAGLSNGDKITLTWEYDKEKASEEYKVDILGESVEFTVTGLTEVEKIDPFVDFSVSFSGASGTGDVDVDVEGYPDYFNHFGYTVSRWSDLSNGDEVVISFDVSAKDWVAEQYGYELYPAEKVYTVSGLTEYVSADAQMTDAAIKPLMASAEKLFFEHVNDYWVQEASVKKLECVGHFVSLPESMYSSVKNTIGLIYKVNATIYKEERNLDVEYYYPVLFENVILREDGTFAYEEDDMFRTNDRFYKQYEPENEEDVNVPSGSWYFYGYETLEGLKEEYTSYSASWTTVETENFVEKNYTEAVYATLKNEQEQKATQIKNGNAEALAADAIGAFLETITGWQDTASVNGVKCVETILYTGDVVSPSVPENYLDVVLEVSAKVEYEEAFEEFPFYYVVRYPNVTVGADGKLTADFAAREAVNGQFKKMLGEEEIYTGWFSTAVNVWVYNGYQTAEEAEMEEIRQNRFFYKKAEVMSYVAEAIPDMTTWGNADDATVVAAAEAAYRETTAQWPESATVNSVECVDTYLISNGVPTEGNQYAVLLKVNASVAFADRMESFDYYYVVRYGNAQVNENGVVTVDENSKWVPENPFTKMLGDEEVPGPEEDPVLNVWEFDGFATVEEAEATILAKRENHVNYIGVKVPEPVVEEPAVEDPAETPETEGDGTAEGTDAVTPDAEGDAPAEDGDAATEPVEEDVAA